MYTTSIMKTNTARYEILGIEDMVPMLWSTIKHAYDKDAAKGIKYWGERQILGVKSVSVKKLHGYGHLEEVMVKRADQRLCKFKEGDFVDLHLNDIEDMLLLAIQHKLFHLNESDIIDFIVALLMRADELYKFSDGTLKKVQDELHHRILDFRLGYNDEMSRRKWTTINKKRSELMVELIDKQMRERRIIRNLERLVGARELEMDYKLMTHSHHGPSDAMHNPSQPLKNIRVMPKRINSDDGNPSRANIKQALRFLDGGSNFRYYDTARLPWSDEVLKLKNFKKDGYTSFQNQEKYEHYEELSALDKLQADCDLKATNIVLQGLPPDVYAIVNHHKVVKEIWDRVKLLMQGTSLSLQERECKLYDEFDKFTHVKGETLMEQICDGCEIG
ncbi:hypothetical protein Tco_0546951 [Tanacetum coccineum]